MMNKWTIWVAVASVALALSTAAYADTVQVLLNGAPGWGAGAPGGYAPMSTDPRQICTGIYRLQVNTANGSYTGTNGQAIVDYASGHGGLIDSFCADIWQDAPTTFQTYQIENLNDDAAIFNTHTTITKAQQDQKVADLYKLFANFTAPHLPEHVWTNDSAAAFQACVWEIINETPGTAYNVDNTNLSARGTFYEIGASWTPTADTWLSNLSSLATVDQTTLDLFVLANPSAQDYAAVGMGVGTSPIPEPLTMLGVLAGIAGIGRYVRNRGCGRVAA